MEPKRNRPIGLIIRRFFAVFILFTTVLGIISSIEEDTFTDETIGSAFVSLLIVYYLARFPRKNRQISDVDFEKTNNGDIENSVEMDELLEEFEENLKEIESQEVQTSYKSEKVTKNNPVKDNQSFISRIFQGRTDRY
mgnify:CR=1 FL=1|tara:strand:- start:69 stop:482 length:414 start_codon:yes stop_codon:yes gene_type:complete